MHPHVGVQLDRGLYAPLLVDDPAEPGRYDAEFTVVLDDWLDGTGRDPDRVLADLRSMAGMDMGGMDMGAKDMAGMRQSRLLSGDAGDVTYPHYLVNGRLPTASVTLRAKPRQRARLRIINAGGDTAFRIALGGHRLTVTPTGSRYDRTRRTATALARSSRSPTARSPSGSNPTTSRSSRDGRVMEVLSEHSCHGWLEGYTLTGRHGMFATYEAFAMISAAQTVQHAKWLEEASKLPWRATVPSLNVLVTSTAWRNDHNGFSHQGPGLLQVALNQRAEVTRIYLPPDANCLLSVADHCLRSRSYVNLLVIDKQPSCSGWTCRRRSSTAGAAPARGSGPATTTAAETPTSSWRAPAMW